MTTSHKRNADEIYSLLRLAAAQDEKAFARLYDLTATQAFAVARGIIGDSFMAEDILNEAYLKVWQQARKYSAERGSALGWILLIVRSKALDYLRKQASRQRSEDSLRTQSIDDEGSAASSPAHLLELVDRRSAIKQALESLTHSQQQLLALAFFRDLSHQEIARQTGMPLGTVKTRLRTSLRALKSLLGDAANYSSAYEI